MLSKWKGKIKKSKILIPLKQFFSALDRVIRILVFLKTMHCYCLKMLTEWQLGILNNRGEKILKRWKNFHEVLQIRHDQNADITFLEASLTISVTYSINTFEDTLLLLENHLTDRDERPHTPGYLSFKTLLAWESFWF